MTTITTVERTKYSVLFFCLLAIGLAVCTVWVTCACADGEFTCQFDIQSGDARVDIYGDASGQSAVDQVLSAFQDRAAGSGRFVDAQSLVADIVFSSGGFVSSLNFEGDGKSMIRSGSWEAAGGVTRIDANKCLMDTAVAGVDGEMFDAVTQIGGCGEGTSAALLVENLIGSAFFDRLAITHSNTLDENENVVSSSVSKDRQRVKVGGMGDIVARVDIKYIQDCSVSGPADEEPWWPPGICDPARTDPELHPEPWYSIPLAEEVSK